MAAVAATKRSIYATPPADEDEFADPGALYEDDESEDEALEAKGKSILRRQL